MQIGIVRESLINEARVAASPASVKQLIKLGFSVLIEPGAGLAARFSDADYVSSGALIEAVDDVWQADLLLRVNAPNDAEIKKIKPGATVISFVSPAQNSELLEKCKTAKINLLAMDMVPRISRAQSMDALSSMANIAGYRAVVEASHRFGSFFTGQITAAGKVPPAKIMIIGEAPGADEDEQGKPVQCENL